MANDCRENEERESGKSEKRVGESEGSVITEDNGKCGEKK